MMFHLAIIASIVSAVGAVNDLTPNGEISANSAIGMRLLREAKLVQPAHHRNDQQEERDTSFVANYSIRYLGCQSLTQLASGENENHNNNQPENVLYTQYVARFALCPSSFSCDKCEGGGEYVMNMELFVDAFTEALLTEQEYACESVREACDCENANDDVACEAACYSAAGFDNCINDGNQQEFEVQRFLQCDVIGGGNNNNAVNYYVGPYCSPVDQTSIYLGVFTDPNCDLLTDVNVFATINGYELPFTSTSLVNTECMSCLQATTDNSGEITPTESCIDLYNHAARCEVNMDITSKDESGCDFINNVLPSHQTNTNFSLTRQIRNMLTKWISTLFS